MKEAADEFPSLPDSPRQQEEETKQSLKEKQDASANKYSIFEAYN